MLDKYITQAQLKKQPYNLSDVNTTYLEYLQDMTKEFIERNIERMRQDGMLFQPKAGFIKRT